MTDPLGDLRATIDAAAAAIGHGGGERPTLERPPRPEMGDYSTNAAMLLAPTLGEKPREIAERLGADVGARLGEAARRVEVAGPGFLNLHLTDAWHRGAVGAILESGPAYGTSVAAEPKRVLVEYVSANPTGPLTVAGGRGAAYGDSVARLLEACGHEVGREYLLNDTGGQVERFAASIAAHMRGEPVPEDGYGGDYVADLAADLQGHGLDADDLDALARAGTDAMTARIAATLERFGATFDTWFSERSLHEAGAIESTIEELRGAGHVYEREQAVWLRTSELGDEKDRVLVRAGGQPTYFAADIAYHRDKLDRGWEHMIDPLGADHHGYVPRMRAALEALRGAGEAYEAPIMQLVQVVDGGERTQMSKRGGEFVTLDELIDDIGVDAARYFMLQRSHDTALDLDLDLARKQSQDNPVYYVQYAHARIASILRKAESEGVSRGGEIGLEAAAEPSERALIRRLLELPVEVAEAAARRAPHRLCAYATSTAADFHAFYRDCQVVGAELETQSARLALCVAAKGALATTLGLLGVSAPERM
ncbi:MAG: arginine--tRNA ligase [Solirubrobacterales bacterium]